MIEDGAVTTYAAFNEEVNRLVSGLGGLGATSGRRAAWCGPNSSDVVVLMHACRQLGLVAVPMPYRFTAEESATCWPTAGRRWPRSTPGGTGGRPGRRSADSRCRRLPGGVRGPTWDAPVTEGMPDEPPAPAGEGATMLYTSGTTAGPRARCAGRRTPRSPPRSRELSFGAAEVHLVTGPLYHAGPHAFALLTHRKGGTLVVRGRFDAAAWLRLVARHRVTSAFVAPIHLKRIVLAVGVSRSTCRRCGRSWSTPGRCPTP